MFHGIVPPICSYVFLCFDDIMMNSVEFLYFELEMNIEKLKERFLKIENL